MQLRTIKNWQRHITILDKDSFKFQHFIKSDQHSLTNIKQKICNEQFILSASIFHFNLIKIGQVTTIKLKGKIQNWQVLSPSKSAVQSILSIYHFDNWLATADQSEHSEKVIVIANKIFTIEKLIKIQTDAYNCKNLSLQ